MPLLGSNFGRFCSGDGSYFIFLRSRVKIRVQKGPRGRCPRGLLFLNHHGLEPEPALAARAVWMQGPGFTPGGRSLPALRLWISDPGNETNRRSAFVTIFHSYMCEMRLSN